MRTSNTGRPRKGARYSRSRGDISTETSLRLLLALQGAIFEVERCFAQGEFHVALLTIPNDAQCDGLAWLMLEHDICQRPGWVNLDAFDSGNHIPRFQAGLIRRTITFHVSNDYPVVDRQVILIR